MAILGVAEAVSARDTGLEPNDPEQDEQKQGLRWQCSSSPSQAAYFSLAAGTSLHLRIMAMVVMAAAPTDTFF